MTKTRKMQRADSTADQDSRTGSIEGINNLVPVFNRIQDLLEKTSAGSGNSSTAIQLPQIVVVGSQSSGKSSVLENLVGQPFLPRGTGIVTRCPIILRLVNTPEGEITWCEFEHIPDRKFDDFQDVEREIINQTNKLCGTTGGISSSPIKVSIYSPNVLSFTVVDLPGLVQIAAVNQPADIETQIRDLVLQYISQDSSIILAISPGNNDIATSESLKIAKLVDPTQQRTIAVLTKIDLASDVDKMTETLRGNVVPIKLGIFGVINRTQADIDAKKPIEEVIKFEEKFLREKYPSIARQNGIPYLAHKLNRILSKHIAAHCPGLQTKVRTLMLASETELGTLGLDSDMTDDEKRQILISSLDKFAKSYKAQIDGQGRSSITSTVLTKGTTIDLVLSHKLNADLNALEPFKNLEDYEILIAIRNALPVGARMITPEVALNHFIKEEIRKVAPLATRIADRTHQEMVSTIGKCLRENNRFPKLNAAIFNVVSELLSKQMDTTKDLLTVYFEIQSDSAWTANPVYYEFFKDSMSSISVTDLGELPMSFVHEQTQTSANVSGNVPKATTSAGVTTAEGGNFTAEQLELCKRMRALAAKVFELVRWQLQDFIAKAILSTLIFKAIDEMATTLNIHLNVPDKIEKLIKEPDEINARRVILKQEVEGFHETLKLLEDLITESL